MNDALGGKDRRQATVGNAIERKCARESSRARQSRKRRSGRSSCVDTAERQNEGNWLTFEQMYAASRGSFLRIAYGILQNKEDAEDAIQDALLSAYVHLRGFEGRSALKTWFTRVVLNAALMIRRKRKPVQVVSAAEWASEEVGDWMDGIPSPEPDPEMRYAKAETVVAIRGLIANLRPALQQPLTMCCLEEMSVRQARTSLGLTTATYKARLFRARRELIRQARRVLSDRPPRTRPYGSPNDTVVPATPAERGPAETALL